MVKFYNCIKQIIKKIIKKWLNFTYSVLKLRQLKTPLLTNIMVPESSSMIVNCDSYNRHYLHMKTATIYTIFKVIGVAAGNIKPPH